MSKKKLAPKLFGVKRAHQLWLLVVPFCLYVQTCWFDFSYHDDDVIILSHFQTLHDFDLHAIFFSDAWLQPKEIELYRPWQSLTYAVDSRLSGAKAGGFHFHNVVIFCLCIQLLYLFLLALRFEETTAFLLALIYGVHFLFAHTASWIPARGDLYVFAFSIGCMLLFYMHLKKRDWLYLATAAVCYFGALLSKENAIVLLPLVYLGGYIFWQLDLKKLESYALLGVGAVLTGLYLWMRAQSVYDTKNIFTAAGVIYNLPSLPEAVCKFFEPLFFSVMPAFNPMVTAIGAVLVLAMMVLYWLQRGVVNRKLVLVGACMFLLPLLPSLVYKPSFSGFAYDYLDHRMFFPGIGLLLITFALLQPWLAKRNLPLSYGYALAAVMFVIAFINARSYANYRTYYDNATTTNPKSGLAWGNYGTMLARENNYDGMFDKFNHALALNPNNIELRMKLADSYYTVKDFPNMERQCRAVIAIDPTFAKAYYDMALHLSDQKQNDTALALMKTCLAKNPKNSDAYYYRAMLYKNVPNNDSTLADLKRSVSLNPRNASAYFELGFVYGNAGKFQEAFDAYDKYLAMNPNDGRAYFYRGQSLCLLHRTDAGCRDLHTALNLGVPDAQAKIDMFCGH